MSFQAELDTHRIYPFLWRARMGLRDKIISRVPRFMVGVRILLWQLDGVIYQAEMAIERKIWNRRQDEYHQDRHQLRQDYFDRIPFARWVLAKQEADRVMAHNRSF